MNFRNRKLVTSIRVIFGLFLLFSGISGISAGLHGMQGVPEAMIPASQALWNMGLFQMIKITEIVVGLMFISGFLPALAAIIEAPIAVGIIVFNARMAPAFVPTGIIVALLTAYLGYAYWDKYQALFRRK